jgi:hypothetical protein
MNNSERPIRAGVRRPFGRLPCGYSFHEIALMKPTAIKTHEALLGPTSPEGSSWNNQRQVLMIFFRTIIAWLIKRLSLVSQVKTSSGRQTNSIDDGSGRPGQDIAREPRLEAVPALVNLNSENDAAPPALCDSMLANNDESAAGGSGCGNQSTITKSSFELLFRNSILISVSFCRILEH